MLINDYRGQLTVSHLTWWHIPSIWMFCEYESWGFSGNLGWTEIGLNSEIVQLGSAQDSGGDNGPHWMHSLPADLAPSPKWAVWPQGERGSPTIQCWCCEHREGAECQASRCEVDRRRCIQGCVRNDCKPCSLWYVSFISIPSSIPNMLLPTNPSVCYLFRFSPVKGSLNKSLVLRKLPTSCYLSRVLLWGEGLCYLRSLIIDVVAITSKANFSYLEKISELNWNFLRIG